MKKAQEMLSNVKLALTLGASYLSTASYFPSNYIHLKKILIDQLELINAQDWAFTPDLEKPFSVKNQVKGWHFLFVLTESG